MLEFMVLLIIVRGIMEKTSNLRTVMGLKDTLKRSVEYSRDELSRTLPVDGDEVGLSRYDLAIKSVTAIRESYKKMVDDCFARGEITQREKDSLINKSNGDEKGFQPVIWEIKMLKRDAIGVLAAMEEDRVYGLR